MSVVRGSAALIASTERPLVLLVETIDEAPELETPGLDGGAREAQLRVGDAKLRRPSFGGHLRCAFPHRIPRGGAVELVAAHAGRGDLEPDLVEMGVIGIEDDRNLVGRERVE